MILAFLYWIKHKNDTDIYSQGYVGVTSRSVTDRLSSHIKSSKKHNLALHSLLESGEYDVITICECTIEYAGYMENKLRPREFVGLNRAIGGNVVKMTEEGKRKVSDALKGRPKPKHVIDAMNSARINKSVSDSTRVKISQSNKGKVRSEETKQKISEARKGVSVVRKKISTERSVCTFNKKHPLDLPNLNLDVWYKVNDLYLSYCAGESKYVASKKLNFSKGSLNAMWKRFDSGYNPTTDQRTIDFVATSNTEN